jgi:circadian clock protein KaiC
LQLASAVAQGRVELLWQLPTERMLDALAHQLMQAVDRSGVKRLVIDGLVAFQTSSPYPERLSGLFSALTEKLHRQGVTTLLTEETRELFVREIEAPIPGISGICENILFLRQVEVEARLQRLLSVMKTRDRAHDSAFYGFDITEKGVVVGQRFRTDRSVLTGISRSTSRPAKKRPSKKPPSRKVRR